MTDASVQRHSVILVAPSIVLGAVALLLVVARHYDQLPIRPGDCVFPERFGIPCAGCGGTRAMRALSHGDFRSALALHPAAVLGVFAAIGWFGARLVGYQAGRIPASPVEQRAAMKRGIGIAVLLIAANWIYLINFPPP